MIKSAAKKKNFKKNPLRDLEEEVAGLRRQLLIAERTRFDGLKEHKAKLSLEKSSQESSLLAAGVSHEFNNIIGSLEGLTLWALESGKAKDMKEALENTLIACQRSSQITKALQGLAQPREEERKVISLKNLLDDLKKVFSNECRQKKLEILFDKSTQELSIYIHSLQILEILINLVKNALESSSQEKLKVKVRVGREGEFVFIHVEDNGQGIPELIQESIFQPFFTTKGVLSHTHSVGDKALTPQSKGGSGLGLYLCLRLAFENSSSLRLVKSTSKGSLFELKIPISS